MKKVTGLLFLVLLACNENRSETNEEEYYRKSAIAMGKFCYYFEREEVQYYFDKTCFYDTSKVTKDDALIFFDSVGNIVFQALFKFRKEGTMYVFYQDCLTGKDVIRPLSLGEINKLSKSPVVEIKCYKRLKPPPWKVNSEAERQTDKK